ncbi:cobalamin adenosyltransferase [Sporanaerobium hydrogeniformans]|uniref:Cobalamin adenosyltransferase n=1 Tax=Sporanaerobium hydrogeniformans TaxID=3072179 RepID=A0AC61DAI0_9FIRM|nr:cobalamin adenosyltransferase [Sporanaerobium hydrogeniformans]PHV70291.1 cobalamin adenosyltransferase [Sporanaerobium hydrogeniformans]
MSVLTENDIRHMLTSGQLKEKGELVVAPGRIITPSARAYLLEKNIELKIQDNPSREVVKMNTEDTKEAIKEESYDTLFGGKLLEKPEDMTHLRGNLLVFKDHPRIAFRGAIDSLEAEMILVQLFAQKQNIPQMIKDLEEIIRFIRNLLRSEVCGEPIGDFRLQDLDAVALREHSHHPSKYYGISHFLPNYKQGEMVAYLNKLRTLTRETELIAYKAFKDEYGQTSREDIIKALNRLSSLFWIMMFKYLAGKYN